MIARTLGLVGIACLLPACAPPAVPPEYRDEIEAWRDRRDERLRSEDGWLTLAGLHWLSPGENRMGTGEAMAVTFPDDAAAHDVGALWLEDGRVRLEASPGAGLTLDGRPVTKRELRTDAAGDPDVLHLGRLRFYVIERGERFAVRVKDPASPVLRSFTGMDYFPVDPRYRVEAEWVPYRMPRELPIPTAVGTAETMLVPGRAEFEIDGRSLSLEPVIGSLEDEELFFIFKDETSGQETYGAGRFLYADRPDEGRVVLDFNKAYNPPCVFTPYATCPLPPKQNHLEVRIEAGEKDFGDHAG